MSEPLCCVVGCYSLDLYCAISDKDAPWHDYDIFPVQFTGRGIRDAIAEAKRAGWAVHPRRKPSIAICPACRSAGIGVMEAVRIRRQRARTDHA